MYYMQALCRAVLLIHREHTVHTLYSEEVEKEAMKRQQSLIDLQEALTVHAAGPDVALLQKMLAQDEYVYPSKKITGYYGKRPR